MQAIIEDFTSLSPFLNECFQAYLENRPYSALLIHGLDGVGKKTFSELLAKALFCENEHKRPCFACPACLSIDKNEAPQLIEIKALDKSIKIEDIRGLLEKLEVRSIGVKSRLVLIEDADLMTVSAQNALLKSLEEPYENCFFILTTSHLSRVLQTIQSRCTKLYFPVWENKALENKAKMLNLDFSFDLIRLCSGSIGRLISFSTDEKLKRLSDIAISLANSDLSLRDFPQLSLELSIEKDNARDFLYMLEKAISFSSSKNAVKKLNAVINARKMLDSNVSFQGLIDYMLINISEDR